ncbi:DapH/DapD/GlmU-related protein, partial [Neisseria sp. HMSC072C05]|uniref:DapH/DapD/GlmU-related protein n=1 Tax=Neisseria sp. HMSC072C05 TaxID=1715112 RepID=UPI000AADE56E
QWIFETKTAENLCLDFGCWGRAFLQRSPIVIEDDVWIGRRAIIMGGVRVGKGAVIGAGAVVTKDVLPYCVAAGNPAVIKKNLLED